MHVARIRVMLIRAHSPCSVHCLIVILALEVSAASKLIDAIDAPTEDDVTTAPFSSSGLLTMAACAPPPPPHPPPGGFGGGGPGGVGWKGPPGGGHKGEGLQPPQEEEPWSKKQQYRHKKRFRSNEYI